MPAFIKRLNNPSVRMIKGESRVVKIGLIKILIRVKIAAAINNFMKSAETSNPDIKLAAISTATKLEK